MPEIICPSSIRIKADLSCKSAMIVKRIKIFFVSKVIFVLHNKKYSKKMREVGKMSKRRCLFNENGILITY